MAEEFDAELNEIFKKLLGLSTEITCGRWNLVCKRAILCFLWTTRWKYASLARHPVLENDGKTYHGWRRHLMKNSNNGFWIFPKINCRRFMIT